MLNVLSSKLLPTPEYLKEKLPLTDEMKQFIINTRSTIKNILSRKDPRFLVILGPCSIHDIKAANEYANNLKLLSSKVQSKLFLIMRVHVEKPRTTLGWKGLIHDPFLDGSDHMEAGLEMARSLFIDLAEKKVPAAMEFLGLISAHYLADLISWGTIGARTSSSQQHRELASCLPMPIGFKNSTNGDILAAIQGAFSASYVNTFMSINDKGLVSSIQSKGNKHTHIVLRGGAGKPNYDKNSINDAMELCHKMGIKKELIIDCSHDNSDKDHRKQKEVFNDVLNQVLSGNHHIIGAMLESHLFSGNQPHTQSLKYAISITDPCIDWIETEKIILDAFEKLPSYSYAN